MIDTKVSVVVPVYNRADVVTNSIDSVLSQTHSNIEILIIDDGSTDVLSTVLDGYSDNRIRLIELLVNKGVSAARNAGIREATGGYIAFLDSDDLWLPDKLQLQLAEHMQNNVDTASVTAYQTTHPITQHKSQYSPDENYINRNKMIDGCDVCPGSTLLVSKNVFSVVGGFNESLRRLEDWEWFLRYFKHYSLVVIDDILSDINPSGYGDPVNVEEAANCIYSSFCSSHISHPFNADCRRLLATLQIYEASSLYVNKQYIRCAYKLLSSSCNSPSRFLNFVRKNII